MKIITSILVVISIYFLLFNQNSTSEPQKEIEFETHITITGLNKFSHSDLLLVKKTIKNNFDLDCKISESIEINSNKKHFVCEDAQVKLGKSVNFEYSDIEPITIYVTSSDLYSKNLNVRGLCFGNQIYIQNDKIKVNTIHELSHSFGLVHCQNECIMNSYAMNRWNTKTDKPIFCSSCKSKLP